jgi:hypothetical protein
MERHETTMRAARYLLGAGTFAAAMLAMTATNASAATESCYRVFGEDPLTVCGHVYDSGGAEVPAVTVAITDDGGNNVAPPTESGPCDFAPACGYYTFYVPEPGTYWVCLITDPLETDCSEPSQHPEAQQVTVNEGGHIVDFTLEGSEDPDPNDVWGVGTGTPGYWKNHWEAWPQAGITVGGVNYLNQTTPATPPDKTIYDAIKMMGKVGGDKTVSMFAALISAKLNATLENNTACIADTIAKADLWMAAHPVGSGVKASSPAWVEADAWHTLLDDYNNGKLCAPHRN